MNGYGREASPTRASAVSIQASSMQRIARLGERRNVAGPSILVHHYRCEVHIDMGRHHGFLGIHPGPPGGWLTMPRSRTTACITEVTTGEGFHQEGVERMAEFNETVAVTVSRKRAIGRRLPPLMSAMLAGGLVLSG
jgi:hypothetical protein